MGKHWKSTTPRSGTDWDPEWTMSQYTEECLNPIFFWTLWAAEVAHFFH